MKIWEAWGDPDIGANCFTASPLSERNLQINVEFAQEHGEEFVHLYSIIAPNYISAMTEYWKVQGWGEYKPDAWILQQVKDLDL